MKKPKKTRITLDLDPDDLECLEKLGGTKAPLLRKAIRLLDQLVRGEVFLHTLNGDRIPTEIILP